MYHYLPPHILGSDTMKETAYKIIQPPKNNQLSGLDAVNWYMQQAISQYLLHHHGGPSQCHVAKKNHPVVTLKSVS
jgi:hypothetical protein